MDDVKPSVGSPAPPAQGPGPSRPRRMRRRLFWVLVVVVAAWAAWTIGWVVADRLALDARTDQLVRAWTADPARLQAAVRGQPFRPPNVGGLWQWGGNTRIASIETTTAGLRALVTGGACDDHPWKVTTRWTEYLLVLDARPDIPPWPEPRQIVRNLTPRGCSAQGLPVWVDVALSQPIGDRLVVDAWSGAALTDVTHE